MITLHTTDIVIRSAGVAILLLIVAVMLRDYPFRNLKFVISAACLATIAYLIQSSPISPYMPTLASFALLYAASLTSMFVWLICCYMFVEDFRLRSIYGAIAVVYAALMLLAQAVGMAEGSLAAEYAGISIGLIKAGLAIHVFFLIVPGINDDLVEGRRKSRILIMSLMATFVLIGSAMGVFLAVTELPDLRSMALPALVTFAAFIVLQRMLVIRSNDRFLPKSDEYEDRPVKIAENVSTLDRSDHALLVKLNDLMEEEKLFLQPDLTIASLADSVGIPEHKLRTLINQGLEYRNFSTFLNHYRIAEAKSRLHGTTRAQASILDVAMAVGYRSIGPFNRAFKDITELTPSQYRRQRSSEVVQGSSLSFRSDGL